MPAPRKTTSSNSDNQRVLAGACIVNDALTRVAARWKVQILYFIAHGTGSFAALKGRLPGVSDHMLATRLRELVAEGLADKHATSQGRHAYQVTARGQALLAIIEQLCAWEQTAAQ